MKLNIICLLLTFSFSCFAGPRTWLKTKIKLKKGTKVYAKDIAKEGVYLLGKIISINKDKLTAKVKLPNDSAQIFEIDNLKLHNPPARNKYFKANEMVIVEKTTFGKKHYLQAIILKRKGRKYSVYIQSSIIRRKELIKKSNIKKMLSINGVNAPGCGRVNFLYKKWIKPTGMPQYNQGPDGMCYAYTGLQLIDFYREAHGTIIFRNIALGDAIYGGLISRVHLQKQRRLTSNKKQKLGFGKSADVISAVRKYGMCRSDVIEESLKKFGHNKKVNSQEFYFLTLYFLTHYTENIDSATTPPTRARALQKFFNRLDEDEKAEAADRTVRNYLDSRRGRRWGRNIRNNIDIQKVREFMDDFVAKKDYVGFMKKVFSKCLKKENIILNSKKIPPLTILTKRDLKNPMTAYKTILKQLNREKPTGLGISYCSKVLKKPKYVGLVGGRSTTDKKCGNHASLIVGKRARGGRCQFLLRNTWGNSCRYKWECERNKNGKEEGIWVDAEALINNTYELQFFDPR